MLSNSLPNSIDRSGVAEDCIARDRSVIGNLTKHHFKMGDSSLCSRTTLNR